PVVTSSPSTRRARRGATGSRRTIQVIDGSHPHGSKASPQHALAGPAPGNQKTPASPLAISGRRLVLGGQLLGVSSGRFPAEPRRSGAWDPRLTNESIRPCPLPRVGRVGGGLRARAPCGPARLAPPQRSRRSSRQGASATRASRAARPSAVLPQG